MWADLFWGGQIRAYLGFWRIFYQNAGILLVCAPLCACLCSFVIFDIKMVSSCMDLVLRILEVDGENETTVCCSLTHRKCGPGSVHMMKQNTENMFS